MTPEPHKPTSLRRASLLVVAVWLAVAAVGPAAGTPGLSWQPGFPMRAGNQVLLMWTPLPGATRYRVERKDLASQETKRWVVPGTQHVDPDARPDRTYLYSVEVLRPDGTAGPSTEVTKVEGFRPLDAPQWGGHYQEAGAVNLVWGAVAGAAFYNLYRAAEGAESTLLASVQDVKYVDAAVTPGATYTYRVRAVGTLSQESPDSDPLTITVAARAEGRTGEAAVQKREVAVVSVFQSDAEYQLREPTDLAVAAGQLYVTDLGSRSVLVLDAEDGGFEGRIAEEPPDYAGPWGIPWGIGLRPDGEALALTFLRSPSVRVFTPAGDLVLDVAIARPPGFASWPGVPQPMDVAVGPRGDLWITEYTYGQVVHLDARGRELGRVGVPRSDDDAGPFRSPTFTALDPRSGEVFVVDSLLARVFVIGPDGVLVRDWARARAKEGTLNLPKGICRTRTGDLLVVDGIRSSLQAFGPDGALRAVYRSPDEEFLDLRGLVSVATDPRTGALYLLSKVDSAVFRLLPP